MKIITEDYKQYGPPICRVVSAVFGITKRVLVLNGTSAGKRCSFIDVGYDPYPYSPDAVIFIRRVV